MMCATKLWRRNWRGEKLTETYCPGHAFTVPDNLFAKITDEQREEWTERFKGTRA